VCIIRSVRVIRGTAICVTGVGLAQIRAKFSGRQSHSEVGSRAPAAVTAISATNKPVAIKSATNKFAADDTMADKCATGDWVSNKSMANNAVIKASVEAAMVTATPAMRTAASAARRRIGYCCSGQNCRRNRPDHHLFQVHRSPPSDVAAAHRFAEHAGSIKQNDFSIGMLICLIGRSDRSSFPTLQLAKLAAIACFLQC